MADNIDHGNYVAVPPAGGVRIEGSKAVREVCILGSSGSQAPSECYTVDAGSKLELTIIALPGTSAKVPLTIDLVGEGAQANLSGIFICNNEDAVDFDITMIHRVGRCTSNQLFNGVAADRSHCGFFGRIIVAPDAQKTEAFQTNHNLLLSEEAVIDTKPRLEIYADDVKCSHGATIGRLNEEEQYYMRSRGIPENEAKVLQMISFLAPVIAGLPETDEEGNPCREAIRAKVEEALRTI